jgi:hypothetical protein
LLLEMVNSLMVFFEKAVLRTKEPAADFMDG